MQGHVIKTINPIRLRCFALLVLGAWSISSVAAGLGPIQIESSLAQPFRAAIPVYDIKGAALAEQCVKVRAETPNGEFVSFLDIVRPVTSTDPVLALRSTEKINEPALSIHVDVDCGIKIRRTYFVLLDPVSDLANNLARNTPVQSLSENHNSSVLALPIPVTAVTETASSSDQRKQLATQANSGKPPKAVPKDTLKLSALEASISTDLQLADTLSLKNSSSKASSEALLLARREFAAILRDENLLQSTLLETDGLQRKILESEEKLSALAKKNTSTTASLKNLSQDTYPVEWVAGLAGMLVFSLGTIGWLVWRERTLNTPREPWHAGIAGTGGEPTALDKFANVNANVSQASDWQEPHFDTTAVLPPAKVEFSAPSWMTDDLDGSEISSSYPSDLDRKVNVEEVSDVVQQAEFWMMLNEPHRALVVLESHAYTEYPEFPITWLYLLDLYRVVGDSEKYNDLAKKFKRGFNARIPPFDEDPHATLTTSVTDLPMLMTRINAVWEDDEKCLAFLHSLLIDDRNGERVGFDLPVYREIIMLIGLVTERGRLYQAA